MSANNSGFRPALVSGKLTKAAVTKQLLHSGRNGNPGPLFTVDEIVEHVNRVFPGGKGTSKDCVYYYASKEKIGLNRSNKTVDRSAYAALQSLITGEASPEEEEPTSEESTELAAPDYEAMREVIRAEIRAEDAERARLVKEAKKSAQAANRAIRVVKKNQEEQS